MRIDKYLWAIRIYKTRALATDGCRNGHVKAGGKALKASHEVKPGEIFTIQNGALRRAVEVSGLPSSRVDAKSAMGFYIDHSPVVAAGGGPFASSFVRRRGAGRPTKKDRREMDDLRLED